MRPGVTERLGIGPDDCWARTVVATAAEPQPSSLQPTRRSRVTGGALRNPNSPMAT